MKPANIYHRPQSEFAFALDDTHYIFRLRTAPGEAQQVQFFFADRASMAPRLDFHPLPMPLVSRDSQYDWYELQLETPFDRIAYYFQLTAGNETLLYYGDCYEHFEHSERSDYFMLPFNHRADRLQVPEWTKDAIVYNIFPDSFASGREDISSQEKTLDYQGKAVASLLGGTLRGIVENLPYIAEQGYNCVYLNPIFAAGCYHKYDTLDYYAIDPCMGTEEDLHALVKTAHGLGLRVILDGVFNHISSDHPYFQDVLRSGIKSPYYDWFYQLPEKPQLPGEGEDPQYTCFAYVAHMPKTDTSNPEMQAYFCKVGVYWIERFDIDGWRLDVANEVDDGFLRAFRKAVKQAKPDAIIVGEVWENAGHYLAGDMLDSAMNYEFRRYCRRFFAERTVDAETFAANISTLLYRYRRQATFAQLNLLDSHDVCRFFTLCGEDVDKMELAILFQMTFPGMPCVFYGDEKGMTGMSEPEYRSPMQWQKTHALERIYPKLIALRKEHSPLRYGSFEMLLAQDGILRYGRTWEARRIVVTMNLSGKPIPSSPNGRLLLKKGSESGMIHSMEYELWEEPIHGGNNL